MWKKIIFISYFLVFFSGIGINSSYAGNNHNSNETLSHLRSLTNYEMDYSSLLSQCGEKITNNKIRENIVRMKECCETNIRTLCTLIQQYGGTPPAYGKDLTGFIMQGYTAVRGSLTEEGVLRALQSNQRMILKAFEAAPLTLPDDVKEKIEEIVKTKREEIQFIESQIRS